MKSAQDWIAHLKLTAHPEGGYYAETYKSEIKVGTSTLPDSFATERRLATSIYFLIPSHQVSKFHRLKADEIWYYHHGSALTVHAIDPEGNHHQFKVGPDFENGQLLQVTIPAGWIFGSLTDEPDSFSIVGCMVAPGFEYEDFELFDTEALLAEYPQHEAIIRKLT